MHAELTLRGTPDAPILLGTLTLKDVHGELSNMPVTAQELGGTITFSQDRLYIDGIRGTVNDGAVQLRGMLGFEGLLTPGQLDLALSVDSAQMAIPAWLPSTISGDIPSCAFWGPTPPEKWSAASSKSAWARASPAPA